jgi:hypothetical protein
MKRITSILALTIAGLLAAVAPHVSAQRAPVTLDVQIIQTKQAKHPAPLNFSNVVIWLMPLDSQPVLPPLRQAPTITQRDKSFEPHLLVVPVGTVIQFPNKDPFFHNVFSLFDGKRFDLGLYEAGSSKPVHFDRAGVSFLFCNIHPEMSAVVVAVGSPYYAVSDKDGHITLPNVPDGRYEVRVWFERSMPAELNKLTQDVTISDSNRALGTIKVMDNPNFSVAHKNKYGQDYVPPPTTGYNHE